MGRTVAIRAGIGNISVGKWPGVASVANALSGQPPAVLVRARGMRASGGRRIWKKAVGRRVWEVAEVGRLWFARARPHSLKGLPLPATSCVTLVLHEGKESATAAGQDAALGEETVVQQGLVEPAVSLPTLAYVGSLFVFPVHLRAVELVPSFEAVRSEIRHKAEVVPWDLPRIRQLPLSPYLDPVAAQNLP